MIGSHVEDCVIIPGNPDDPHKYYSKIPILRKQNPKLKIMLSNGGGGHEGMTEILGSEVNTTKYVLLYNAGILEYKNIYGGFIFIY